MNVKQGKAGIFLLFLSCLFGSEHPGFVAFDVVGFLSCLFGSEHARQAGHSAAVFLSCLFGSEPGAGMFGS